MVRIGDGDNPEFYSRLDAARQNLKSQGNSNPSTKDIVDEMTRLAKTEAGDGIPMGFKLYHTAGTSSALGDITESMDNYPAGYPGGQVPTSPIEPEQPTPYADETGGVEDYPGDYIPSPPVLNPNNLLRMQMKQEG